MQELISKLPAMQAQRQAKAIKHGYTLATSYSLNHTVYAVHWGFAIALAVCTLTATIWLLARGRLLSLDYALAVLIIMTIAISALPVVNDIPIVAFYIPRELVVFICSL